MDEPREQGCDSQLEVAEAGRVRCVLREGHDGEHTGAGYAWTDEEAVPHG